MKRYEPMQMSIICFSECDILTQSNGNPHGMGGNAVPDQDWQIGEEE